MFQIVPCVIANISWKYHENPRIDFTIVLLTDTPGALDGWLWNSLVKYETVCLIITYVIPDVSWKFHANPLIRFSIKLQTNTDRGDR